MSAGEVTTLPLQLLEGHLFLVLDDSLWLLDTGCPGSFGTSNCLSIAGESFSMGRSYPGLNVEMLSHFIGVPCAGLIGGNVLDRFDHIFDVTGGQITLSTGELSHFGECLHLDKFMDVPIVTARIGSRSYPMFFDTGAQFSYFQDDSLADYPSAGNVTDFYPGIGQFQTDTHTVPVALSGVEFSLRCGRLPDLLGMTLMMANVAGIIGHSILHDRAVGYFPRRSMLVL